MKRVSMVSMLLLVALAAYHVTAEEEVEEALVRMQRAMQQGTALEVTLARLAGTAYRVVFEFEGGEYAVLTRAANRFSLDQSTTVSSLDATSGKTEKDDKTHDQFNVVGTLKVTSQNILMFEYQLNIQRKTTRAEVDGDGDETGRREQEDINLKITGTVPVSIDGRTEFVLAEVPGKPLSVTIEPTTDWGVGEVRPTPARLTPSRPNNPPLPTLRRPDASE